MTIYHSENAYTFTKEELIAEAHRYAHDHNSELENSVVLRDFGLLVDFIFTVTGEGR